MNFRRVGTTYIMRVYKGEELIEQISAFAKKYGITAGTVSAIGATNNVTIGYFDSEKSEYQKKNIQEDLEILNVAGNIAMVDGEPFAHLHIILGDKNYNTIGGHLFSARISVTCEVFIRALDTVLKREFDEETQLKLLKI